MTTMADKQNAPRSPKRKASQSTNTTDTKVTLQPPDFSRCDRSCGPCFVTFVGDERFCEAEFLAQARRELAELLAGSEQS